MVGNVGVLEAREVVVSATSDAESLRDGRAGDAHDPSRGAAALGRARAGLDVTARATRQGEATRAVVGEDGDVRPRAGRGGVVVFARGSVRGPATATRGGPPAQHLRGLVFWAEGGDWTHVALYAEEERLVAPLACASHGLAQAKPTTQRGVRRVATQTQRSVASGGDAHQTRIPLETTRVPARGGG